MTQTYYRRGFGRRKEIEPQIRADYHSALVDRIRENGHELPFGDAENRLDIRLAEAFGFCYGVDRAVDYAYETRLQYPDRNIYLIGEIIHNPHVNQRMREMGIEFIYPNDDARDRHEFDFSKVTPDDVVIIPAFGVTLHDFEFLKRVGCVLVDTTCGSVLVVWKRVEQYARDGFTALIHGKYYHEETEATASQANKHPGGKYIVVFDMAEARLVMDYIERKPEAMSRDAFMRHFAKKASPDFDPDRDLERIGVANQTTMLSSESLAIAAEVGKSLERRYDGEGGFNAEEHFRSFDTICSATQERQDAVKEMMASDAGPPDIMLVIGGYNSSNTNHLAVLCAQHTITYHIADASCIDPERGTIRFKPNGTTFDAPEAEAEDWLPSGRVSVGLTAGASTPNNKIGAAIERMLQGRGIEAALPEVAAA